MPHRNLSRAVAALVIAAIALATMLPAAAAAPGGKGGGGGATQCNAKKSSCTVDVTPPTVAIGTPGAGQQVDGTFTVAGHAGDDVRVAAVEVQIDGGTWTAATGTTSWSTAVHAAGSAGDSLRVTARAIDSSGNTATTSIDLVLAGSPAPEEPGEPDEPGDPDAPEAGDGWVLADPRAAHGLLPLGRTRLAQWGDLTGVLYTEQFTNRRAIALRDRATGATAYVDLPTDSLAGWVSAATVMTSATDLWVFGGTGPMHVRHYRLHGSPLPSSATLMEQRVLGDGDSRPGDMTLLASGGLVISWLQQGASGPQGQHLSYRFPDGRWQDLAPLTFMPTKSSDQVIGQHPTDGGVWLFSNPDAWGAIGAARLTETATGLRVDWTHSTFISRTQFGLHGPDPENPDLALAADETKGTLALAYQSADRQRFTASDGRSVIGSRIAVASIGTAGVTSFLVAPVWAERVSDIGLVVDGGEVVVVHRPLDPETLAFSEAHAIRFRDGTWGTPTVIGTIAGAAPVTYATGRPEVSARLADGRVHLRSV